MDRVNYVLGQVPPSADMNTAQEGAETAIDRLAKAVLASEVVDGLDLDLAAGTISAGRGYDAEGRHIGLSAALAVDLSTVTRPGAGMVRWVSVALRWVREGSDDVYDRNNVRHDRYQLESAQAVLTAGAEAADAASAARPDFGDDLLIADVLLDESTALDALDVDLTRRTAASRDVGEIDRAVRAIDLTRYIRRDQGITVELRGRDESRDIDATGLGVSSARALLTDGTLVWVAGFGDDEAKALRVDTGVRVPASDFPHHCPDAQPVAGGFWLDGYAYIIAFGATAIRVVRTSDGLRDQSREFNAGHPRYNAFTDGTLAWFQGVAYELSSGDAVANRNIPAGGGTDSAASFTSAGIAWVYEHGRKRFRAWEMSDGARRQALDLPVDPASPTLTGGCAVGDIAFAVTASGNIHAYRFGDRLVIGP